MATRVHVTPPALTKTLGHAALNVYNEKTNPTPPNGYTFYLEWTGKNPIINGVGGDIENYGAIFQSKTNSKSFIMAFRGTAGAYDWLEDFKFFESTSFGYLCKTGPEAYVASGFNDVYTTPTTRYPNSSMQEQLFHFLQITDVEELYITGHSLGSALAELFTLDLYNSISLGRTRKINTIAHINFACPRVGLESFVSAYKYLERIINPSFSTIRVVNYKDYVPCTPGFTLGIKGYYHASNYYLTYFDWDTVLPTPDPFLRHSMHNYLYTLIYQFDGHPSGAFRGEHDYLVYFKTPNSSYTECSIHFFRNMLDFLAKNLSKPFRKVLK